MGIFEILYLTYRQLTTFQSTMFQSEAVWCVVATVSARTKAVRSWTRQKRICLNTVRTVRMLSIRCISERRSFLIGKYSLYLQVEFCKTSHSLPFFLVNTSCKAVSLIVNSSMPFIWTRLSLNRHARALYLLFTSFSFIFHSLWQISFFVAM